MALFAATLLAASTQGLTPASPLNCTHVRTISHDSLDDMLGHTAVAAGVVTMKQRESLALS